MLQTIWKALKAPRRLGVGPITLNYQFERSTRLRSPTGQSKRKPALQGHLNFQDYPSQTSAETQHEQTALLFGAGPGLGDALIHRLGHEGFRLGVASRNAARVRRSLDQIVSPDIHRAYPCDVTLESSVDSAFNAFVRDYGTPSLVVYALQSFGAGTTTEIELPAFEAGWRHNCLGAFLVSRLACRLMEQAGRGTLLLVGSTSSIIGREGHLNLVAGKFGQRGLAQVLAREMWPKGVHVAHIMVDADIREETAGAFPQSEPRDIAETLLFLHRQPKSAWTSELDLRPWNERFWEHC